MSRQVSAAAIAVLVALAACTAPRRIEPTPRVVVDARVAVDAPATDADLPASEDVAPVADVPLPTCACPAYTACRIVRRMPLTGAIAREQGLRISNGAIRCDPEVVGCAGPLPYASGAELWELTRGCGFWTDRLLVVGRDVYRWAPMSVGERGGPGWALSRSRVEDPRTLRPLGLRLLADARRVYEGAPVAGADVTTFRVLACPVAARRCLACDQRACFHDSEDGRGIERVAR